MFEKRVSFFENFDFQAIYFQSAIQGLEFYRAKNVNDRGLRKNFISRWFDITIGIDPTKSIKVRECCWCNNMYCRCAWIYRCGKPVEAAWRWTLTPPALRIWSAVVPRELLPLLVHLWVWWWWLACCNKKTRMCFHNFWREVTIIILHNSFNNSSEYSKPFFPHHYYPQ